MANPLLQVLRLYKSFNGRRVVDGVDLTVRPGEVRGIVGESGSGKTTLARCSIRLMEPSSGTTFFDGQDLAGLSAAELRKRRREFQMVFQDPYTSLNPRMNIEDILLEPFRINCLGTHEERHQRLRELIEAVSLDAAWMKRKPAELSGGQQQRVGIARALALKPRLLFADEPVSSLDVSVQAQILNLLSDLKKHYDLTLVLISHSLYAIHYLCTHVSVMYRGRILEEAPATHFFDDPKHPYSRMLLDSMPEPEPSARKKVREKGEGAGNSTHPGAGCVFYAACPQRMEMCGKLSPRLKEIGSAEAVACFLYR